jgi:hypothetical protein
MEHIIKRLHFESIINDALQFHLKYNDIIYLQHVYEQLVNHYLDFFSYHGFVSLVKLYVLIFIILKC